MIILLLVICSSLTLKGQNDKNVLKPINTINVFQLDTKIPDIIKDHLSSGSEQIEIHIGGCVKGAINNPIFLIEGLSIIDSTCSNNISDLNAKAIKKIDIKPDTILNSLSKVCGRGLIIMYTQDTAYLSLKLINKLSKDWTFRHPLTEYQLNNKIVTDSEKIKSLSNININSIIKIDTTINKTYLDGLINIITK